MSLPFDKIWTRSFVESVLESFLERSTPCICECSRDFEILWRGHSDEIRSLASGFNKGLATVPPGCSGYCLFYNDTHKADRQIRIDFLNHEINRLSKLSK